MKGQKLYLEASKLYKKMYEIDSQRVEAELKLNLYHKYLKLIRKAAYVGNSEAQFDLAQTFENMTYLDLQNPKFNPKKCVYWYTKACNQNHSNACNNLAHLFEKGQGCVLNLTKALELYKKSADLGNKIGRQNYKILLGQMQKIQKN
jgi:TPR repeat protein